jgi:hypothetical protein
MSSARTGVETFRVAVDPSPGKGLRVQSEVMVEKAVGARGKGIAKLSDGWIKSPCTRLNGPSSSS